MRNGSYRKSYHKVHSRLRSILRREEFLIITDEIANGILTAKRKGTLLKSAVLIEITIRKIDEETTQIFVTAQAQKHWLNTSEYRLQKIEELILHSIS